MKIVVDAMGGDYAPSVVIQGVAQAVHAYDVDITLVGDTQKIEQVAAKIKNYPKERITIVHANSVVSMDDAPTVSVRSKKDSSISVGINLLKLKEADAFVSAGHTGAVVCAATLNLGLLPGIERPGIGVAFPTSKGVSMIIDIGANIDPKPLHLLQYAIMSEAYYKCVLGDEKKPTIGLLNVGEEVTKGTEFIKETRSEESREGKEGKGKGKRKRDGCRLVDKGVKEGRKMNVGKDGERLIRAVVQNGLNNIEH